MEKANCPLNPSEVGIQRLQHSPLQDPLEAAQETPQETAPGASMSNTPPNVVLDLIHEPVQEALQENPHESATTTSQNEVSCPASNQLPSSMPTVTPWVEVDNHTGNSEHGRASEGRQVEEAFPIKAEPVESASESEPEEYEDSDPDYECPDPESSPSDDDIQDVIAEEQPVTPKTTTQRSRRASIRRRNDQVVTIEISQSEKEISLELGLRRLFPGNSLTSRLYPASDVNDDSDEFQMDDEPASPANGEDEIDWVNDIEGFLGQLSVIKGARANTSKPAIPSSVHKNKRKGLSDIARQAIAKNPRANRKEVYKDTHSVQRATRLFTHAPHMDGTGHWKIRGMKSSLYHYQVQGIGWMRARERSRDTIRGGMLCDVMGLGKTLTALTTIFDGRRKDRNKLMAPTLIIVPAQLAPNWRRQLVNHFQMGEFGAVRYYTKDMDEEFDGDLNGLRVYDVVIATYEDVRRSYPLLKIPKDLQLQPTNGTITAWWHAHYDETVGLLHKVRWQRIVIDEGHLIRNEQSQISVAVRALTGQHVWILTGTPLHNSLRDLFPYFNFLKVPHSATLEQFESRYCQGGPPAKARLLATMRPFFKRRTYESTLFGLPVLSMRGLKEEDVLVDFCQAEVLIYDALVRICREKINDLARCATEQQNCIWLMIIRLRLFSSHPLTAQDIVQHILNHGDIFAGLGDLEESDSRVDAASAEIKRFFDSAKDKPCDRIASIRAQQEAIAKRTSIGDSGRLTRDFRRNAKRSHEDENWRDYYERLSQKCSRCNEHFASEIVLTGCAHLYCGDCFNILPDQDGNLAGLPLCCKCESPITEAVTLGAVDDMRLDESLSAAASSAPGAKRKNSRGPQSAKRSRTQHVQAPGSFHRSTDFEANGSDVLLNGDNEIKDLIPLLEDSHLGATLLGSKLTKARDLIRSWLREDSNNKIVVFTHFLLSLRLLEWMCQEEDWPFTMLSGKMPIPARDKEVLKFQRDKGIKVMLSTLTTGGTGIDLTAANKCILLDLWWNLAVEEQAEGRLFRLGQKRDVHCVKLVARGTQEAPLTIDQQMLAMQHTKMENIQGVIGSQALSSPLEQVLQCLGHVTKTNNGLKITKDPPAQSSPEAS